jgi:hypothetical protein
VRKLSLMFAVAAALLFPATTFAGQHHDHDRHLRGHWSAKAPSWFPQLPNLCFPASRADNGPDNQGPPPMPCRTALRLASRANVERLTFGLHRERTPRALLVR